MALVVIGGVAAGLSAAARARRLDPRLEIVVLEKGPVISYGACGLIPGARHHYGSGRQPGLTRSLFSDFSSHTARLVRRRENRPVQT